MKIPLVTVRPRFYVATSETEAFSSWDSLADAKACIARFGVGTPAREQVLGVIQTTIDGREWVHQIKEPPPKVRGPLSTKDNTPPAVHYGTRETLALEDIPQWRGRPVGKPPWERAACGALIQANKTTHNPKKVTCNQCRKTHLWREA